MSRPEFWHIDSPESTATLASQVNDEMAWARNIICPVNDGHQRGGKRISNLSIILSHRAARDDFVWTWGSECLLRDSVLDLFKSSGFTGFETRPVKARFKRPHVKKVPDTVMAFISLIGTLPVEKLGGGLESVSLVVEGGREVQIPASVGMAIRNMTPAARQHFEAALAKATSPECARSVMTKHLGIAMEECQPALADLADIIVQSRRAVGRARRCAAERAEPPADEAQPPRLSELVVTGSGGISPPESGIRLIDHCEACDSRDYSRCSNPTKLIDSSQWDGSDFFNVSPLGYKFVTDRVAEAIREHGLTGVRLIPPDTLELGLL